MSVRVVRALHEACGAPTSVRLPSVIPADAVHRLRCAGCDQSYMTETVTELGVEGDRDGGRLHLPTINLSEGPWRFVSVPVAALAVIAVLMLVEGQDGSRTSGGERAATPEHFQSAPATPVPAKGDGGPASSDAKLVRGSSFSVALPAGWERVPAEGGATFAAVAAGGGADATLWIEREPKLDFASFESRSLDQLRSLAGSARVVERIAAPTPEATVVRLAADAPPGEPEFEVTLRASGPYRFYLATSVQPDASREAMEGAETIHGTFTPEVNAKAGQ
jgi:hypothetical protein